MTVATVPEFDNVWARDLDRIAAILKRDGRHNADVVALAATITTSEAEYRNVLCASLMWSDTWINIAVSRVNEAATRKAIPS